jgi:magnesium transporter
MDIADQIERFLNDTSTKESLEALHPSEVARNIVDFKTDQIHELLKKLDDEFAAKILVEMHDALLEKVLFKLDDLHLARLASTLPSDESAYLISKLSDSQRDDVLPNFTPEEKLEVQELLNYEEEQVGSLMQKEVLTLFVDLRVKDAIRQIRSTVKEEDEEDDFHKAFVVDEFGRLLGEIPLIRLLITESKEATIGELMDPVNLTANPLMEKSDLAQMSFQQDEMSVAVVDKENRVVGQVTMDDLGEVLQEDFDEEISMMAGTGEDSAHESVLGSIKERLPWLLIGLFGGLVLAILLGNFEEGLKEHPEFMFFVPLIMSMAGSVGIQSSSIVVRGLTSGHISIYDGLPRLFRELKIAFFNGCVCSVVIVLVGFIFMESASFGLVVSICLFTVMIVAAIIGVLIPLVLKSMNLEPAYSMGPFITIGNDIFGIMVFMHFGKWLLEQIQ